MRTWPAAVLRWRRGRPSTMRQMVTTSARWGARRKSGRPPSPPARRGRRGGGMRAVGVVLRVARLDRQRRHVVDARSRSAGSAGHQCGPGRPLHDVAHERRRIDHVLATSTTRRQRPRTASSRAWRGSPCKPVWTSGALADEAGDERSGFWSDRRTTSRRCAGAAPQRHLDGQPRLADTTRAEQGHDGRLAEEGEDPLDVVGAPDGRRRRRGTPVTMWRSRGGFLRADLADELQSFRDRADEALRPPVVADGGERRFDPARDRRTR